MAKDQPNVFDLVPLLGSTDLHELEQVKNLLQETLSADKGTMLLNSLVDYFLDTSSSQALDILSSVREPHDKYLLDKMNECMGKQSCRLSTITLLGHVVRKQPPWIHKIARFPLLASLLKCLKTDSDVVVLITGVLVLITLLPMIPQTNKHLLCEYFDIFGRLAAWNQRHPGAQGLFAVHLHASVYSLFHRLYGMYPCNFVSYLRAHYSMKENVDTFEEVVKPMLVHVRIHPELITGTKDYEVDPIRWKRFEPHDIVIECAKISLDSKEASSEEGYSSLSDHIPRRPVDHSRSNSELSIHEITSVAPMAAVRQSLSLSLPYLTVTPDSGSSAQAPNHQSDEMNSSGTKEEMWSPSSMCGMTTPPSSRGMSPTTVSDVSHSASHLSGRIPSTPGDGKLALSPSTPSGSSPLPSLSEDIGQPAQNTSSSQAKVIQMGKELKNVTPRSTNNNGGVFDAKSPVSLAQFSDIVKRTDGEGEDDTINEEILSLTQRRLDFGMRPGLDCTFSGSLDTLLSSHPSHEQNLVSTPDRVECSAKGGEQQSSWSLWPAFTPIENGKSSTFSMSDLTKESMPYEPLFDLALPKVASLFLERKTAEAFQRAEGEKEDREELEGEDLSATSPLEVLDRVIQQGHDTHEKVLKRTLSSQSQSADQHSGGKQHSNKGKGPVSTSSDELGMLRSQLLLLHNQLLYERHKREQHALRNRRLFGRIVNTTALEEQNNSMKTQLKLQEIEIKTVQVSLQEEQRRSRRVLEDREALVNQLQTQIQQLQKERNDYYSKMQELKSDLLENQKKVGEMEAELQKANNKVCNMGHMITQLSIKLNNSENMEQQMAFLNKQLLLLGEANKLCVDEIDRLGPEASKELNMLQGSSLREVERLMQSSLQQSQRLDTAQQRITDLETQLAKKEQVIREQKKLLENVKSQATEQLQASENRYLAQKNITQALQSELLELYSQIELKNLNTNAPAEPTSEPSSPINQRPNGNRSGPSAPSLSADPIKREEGTHMCFNGEISAGSPQTPTAFINGSQEEDLSALTRSFPALPCDSPLSVGSYPSTRSFLGKRAREMFRNKSESHYEGEPAVLTCLSKDLKVQPITDPTESMELEGATDQADLQPMDRPRAYNIQRRRQQDLRIMDYNETLHEH